ncbi:hypothetical protein Tco_1486892 [Tanacetum coccineum]
MLGQSSIEAIHLIRSLVEKYRERQKDLHLAFIDLEKAYDNVPQEALEDNGLRVSREKTKYLRCDFGNVEIALNKEVEICTGDKILQPKEYFRYLGWMMHKSRMIDEDIAHRIKATWLKWRCWPITKALATRMEVAELRMLRWTYDKTMLDMILNGVFRAELEVETIFNKLRRRGRPKLRWEDRVKLDMKELFLSGDMTSDRNDWRGRIRRGG